ncbi:hypothetical protein VST7929_03168 [Vibrio stylophorae]|uniref:Divalent metal cation transporter n=1 Tax=Vibrio stylophorae TaxID=659351 RepID=A0ABN8DY02_9VIBR|nr:divalent metal cation transporter [Vibrio stylophorae]CAH0535666.1 hypothetical protein VST7929_03168 [Vibrio stylophorae]
MNTASLTLAEPRGAIRRFFKSLGPGILMATAAIGGSHLVASTKAGAIYGWQLVGLVLLVNLLKYPFFRAGVQYTSATGKSLQEGYAEMGRSYLYLFNALNLISAVVNTAAVLVFTASLLSYFLPVSIALTHLSAWVLVGCLALLIAGHYRALDSVSKLIMAVLVIATLAAVLIAAASPSVKVDDFVAPSPWQFAALGFIVVMMGWMPAPIEISCLTSLWLQSQKKQQPVTCKSALMDFNVGYIMTALLAVVFLALGALIFHGTGQALESTGIGYSKQLVSMYTATIGEWSRWLIAGVAFLCMLGTTLTVIDGYSRALAQGTQLMTKAKRSENSRGLHQIWMGLVSAAALLILFFFLTNLMAMLHFAMLLAFMTTPIFALLNFILVQRSAAQQLLSQPQWNRYLSWAGLIYLFGFLVLFIWWQWLS